MRFFWVVMIVMGFVGAMLATHPLQAQDTDVIRDGIYREKSADLNGYTVTRIRDTREGAVCWVVRSNAMVNNQQAISCLR